MLSNMVAPVVVKPETLSNQAFIMLNGPPQRAYGNIPNMKDSNQERTIIIYPSCRDISVVFLTKMRGKIPTINVITQLITRAAKALSFPVGFDIEIKTEKNINKALTNNAMPTFLDITLMFILF